MKDFYIFSLSLIFLAGCLGANQDKFSTKNTVELIPTTEPTTTEDSEINPTETDTVIPLTGTPNENINIEIAVPDFLNDDLISYSDEDHETAFALSYPETWHQLRDIFDPDVKYRVELLWTPEETIHNGDLAYFALADFQGSYRIFFATKLPKGANSAAGTVFLGNPDLWEEKIINEEKVSVGYQEFKSRSSSTQGFVKIYVFDCTEDYSCLLAGIVRSDDPFKDEFIDLFDRIANTVSFSTPEVKQN